VRRLNGSWGLCMVAGVDEEFSQGAVAIYAGDTDGLASLLNGDPGLATRTSTVGHRTLLQLIACEAGDLDSTLPARFALKTLSV